MNVSASSRALWAAAVLSLPLCVEAQSSDTSNSPSEEEIRRALEADAKANRASGSAPAPSGESSQTPSSSDALPAPVAAGARVIQSLNPDIALIGDFAAAAFSSLMDMTGGHDPAENGFNLQALELALGANVDPYFRFDSHIVLGNEGIELEEAYGTTSALPAGLQLRAGKFLTRFGRFNPTHPHAWTFADQPLVIGRFFGGDGNRNLGVEVSDLLTFLPWYVEAVLSSTDSRGETARSFLGEPSGEDPPAAKILSPADLQYTAALKQFFPLSDDLSLAVGLSGAFGPNASGEGQRTEIYGGDVYLKYRPLGGASFTIVSLHLEALLRRYHTPDATFADSGAFAHLFWRFEPRWGAGLSAEYVSTPEGHPLDAAQAGFRQRYKANVTFWPTEFSRLRLQYDVEPPGETTGAAHAVFLAAEFAIGAHGAHKF